MTPAIENRLVACGARAATTVRPSTKLGRDCGTEIWCTPGLAAVVADLVGVGEYFGVGVGVGVGVGAAYAGAP
ncbi:hypothetical protein GCM10027418_03580 [Mariniluteicoccus endophyticus]